MSSPAGRKRRAGLLRGTAVVGLITLSGAMTLAVSSGANGVALLASAATEHDMSLKALAAEGALTRTYEETLGLDQLCVALKTRGAQRADDEQAEIRGVHSGLPGEGVVSLAYGFAAREMTRLGEACDASIAAAKDLLAETQAYVGAMRQLAQDRSKPILKRLAAFGDLAGNVEVGLADLRQKGALTETIRQSAAGLAANVPAASGKALKPGQADALAEARTKLAGDAAFLEGLAAEFGASGEKESASFRPLSPAIAPFVYSGEFWVWWAGALGVDFIQVGCLLWLWLAYGRARPQRRIS